MDSLAAGIEQRGELRGEKRGIQIGFKQGEKCGEERGEKRGEKRGIRIGFQRGEDKMMEALQMLKKNLPLETIVEKTGLTLQRLTELKALV